MAARVTRQVIIDMILAVSKPAQLFKTRVIHIAAVAANNIVAVQDNKSSQQ